jgi:hypothetical protein
MLGRHLWVAVAFSVLAFVLACEGLTSPNFAMAQEPLDASCDQYRCAEQEPPPALESETEIVSPFTQPVSETTPSTLTPAPVPTAELVPIPDGTAPAGDDESTEQSAVSLEALEEITVEGDLSSDLQLEDDEETMPDDGIPPEDAEEEVTGPKDYPGFYHYARNQDRYYYSIRCGHSCDVQAEHPSYYMCRETIVREFDDGGNIVYESSSVFCAHPKTMEWSWFGTPEKWEDKSCYYRYNNGSLTEEIACRSVRGGPSGEGVRDATNDAADADEANRRSDPNMSQPDSDVVLNVLDMLLQPVDNSSDTLSFVFGQAEESEVPSAMTTTARVCKLPNPCTYSEYYGVVGEKSVEEWASKSNEVYNHPTSSTQSAEKSVDLAPRNKTNEPPKLAGSGGRESNETAKNVVNDQLEAPASFDAVGTLAYVRETLAEGRKQPVALGSALTAACGVVLAGYAVRQRFTGR